MAKEILEASLHDIYLIEEMENANFDTPWSAESIAMEIENGFSTSVFLREDDQVIGYMNFWDIDNSLELNRICISEEYRGQGKAKFMMDYLLSQALERGSDRIILEVASDNESAIKLYDNFGFRQIHLRENYYENGADALIKVRDIDGI